jgi:hypothetical protein
MADGFVGSARCGPERLANDGDPFEAESEPTRPTASSRWEFEPVLRN